MMARLPSCCVRVAWIAGGVAIAQAVLVSVVAVVLIIEHYACADPEATLNADQYFRRILKEQYFQDSGCQVNLPPLEDLLSASQVFIWLIILLAFSVFWLIASIGLVVVSDESAISYFPGVAYAWVATTVSVTVVDITLAVFFGMDFENLDSILKQSQSWDAVAYRVDLLRMGSLLLMTLSLKGFVLPLVNLALAITLLVLSNRASEILGAAQHSVHTHRPLNAYTTSNKRASDPWQIPLHLEAGSQHAQLNRGFSDIEWRDPQNDNNSRSFDRSDSWHHTRTGPETGGPHPFSYLDVPRGHATRSAQPPPTPVSSPAVLPPWRRDPWEQPPPLPLPDYSPVGGRRLKSALKH